MKGESQMFFINSTGDIFNDVLIPSIFFDLYLPSASGEQLKVYFLGYKSASMKNNKDLPMNNKIIANIVGISTDKVLECWKYWEDKGIINIHYSNNEYSIEFIDIKSKFVKDNIDVLKEITENEDSTNETSEPEEEEFRNMYDSIELIVGRLLTPNEKISIFEAIQKYDIDKSLVILAFEKALKNSGKIKSVNYVIGIMKSWFDNSIKNIDDLENYESENYQLRNQYSLIFKSLGFKRLPTIAEEELMNKWINSYNMNMDIILKACSKSANISNPNLKYFDSIITNWYDKGFRTVEDIENDEIKYKENLKSKQQKPSNRKSKNTKSKFHNFEQVISNNYSNEDLEKLISNPKKK